jgi:hypothetical protein
VVTDKEMLELAAKAAGMNTPRYVIDGRQLGCAINEGVSVESGPTSQRLWNPLTDDGDNARLEAMLGLNMIWGSRSVRVGHKIIKDGPTSERYQDHGGDRQKARRWASVRAAAEIGRAMK